MSGLADALPEFLRVELEAAPGRWRHALYVGLGTSVALLVALTLQVDTFFAPLIAFQALQPHTLCSWSRMLRCIWICAVAVILAILFGSVLLQAPWLLLPCFFLAVSAIIYCIPLSSSILEALAVLPPMIRVLYVGVFHPQEMGAIGLQMWSGYAIGVTTAAVFAHLLSLEHPRDELAAALAASFEATRQRLRAAGERFRDASVAPSPPVPPFLAPLSTRLQLLDRARQDGIQRDDERVLMALMTTAERCEATAEVADGVSRRPIGTRYRRLIDAELAALLAALDAALAGIARATRTFGWRPGDAAAAAGAWPDVVGALSALEARQLALRRQDALAPVSIAEGASVNAFVAELRNLSFALRISPVELERIAAGDPGERAAERVPHSRLRLDPYAARFALKCGLATTIALLIPLVANVDVLFSLVVAPFLVAQTSYGATIEKAPLRLLGVLLGGLIALATMMIVMVNTNDLTVWLGVFFVVITGTAYLALGGPRVSYAVLQLAVTYMFVTVAALPTTDESLALWRAVGNFIGGVLIVVVFRLVAPDYAGRQLIARLGDLLADVLQLLPAADATVPSMPRALALHRDIGFAVADILRLVAEARLEGRQAGIEPTAAVEAAGLAQRIAYRAVAIRRAQSLAAMPPLPPALASARAQVDAGVRAHLGILRRILAVRQTVARPGSRPYRHACRAASGESLCARPDLEARLRALADQLDAVRWHELSDWAPAAVGSVFAELEHLRRIVDLLPALDAQLVRMCVLEGAEEAAGRAPLAIAAAPTSA